MHVALGKRFWFLISHALIDPLGALIDPLGALIWAAGPDSDFWKPSFSPVKEVCDDGIAALLSL